MTRFASMMLAGFVAAGLGAGCAPYRVEYHRARPDYYRKLGSDTPDNVMLPDGTRLVYGDRDKANAFQTEAESENFSIRYQDDDGQTHFRALLPQHVVANALNCVMRGEYELIWDELLAEQTRMAYADEGLEYEDFAIWCEDNQIHLAGMLRRMVLGFVHYEVAVETLGNGVTRCRFYPKIADLFKYRTVEIIQEGFDLKLRVIY